MSIFNLENAKWLIATLTLPAVLAFAANRYQQSQAERQINEARLRLYTELVSKREEADAGGRRVRWQSAPGRVCATCRATERRGAGAARYAGPTVRPRPRPSRAARAASRPEPRRDRRRARRSAALGTGRRPRRNTTDGADWPRSASSWARPWPHPAAVLSAGSPCRRGRSTGACRRWPGDAAGS